MSLIECFEESSSCQIIRACDVGRWLQVLNGLGRAEGRPLVDRGQKSRPPIIHAGLWDSSWVGDGHKGGQVLIL